MKWSHLLTLIPHKVQITSKVYYEVLWSPKIVGGEDSYGLMRPDAKQIVLEQGNTPKTTVTTYLHEVIHAFSEEYDIGLTETQVRKMEKALHYVLKEGNLLKNG